MNELVTIHETIETEHDAGRPVILAFVVRAEGSTYRRPGARLVLTEGGRRIGMVSGGCIEGDLMRKAWWLTHEVALRIQRYDSRSEDDVSWSLFGLGCNGLVDIAVQRLDPGKNADAITFGCACLERRTRGMTATVLRTQEPDLAVGQTFCFEFLDDIYASGLATPLVQLAVEAFQAPRTTGSGIVEHGETQLFLDVTEPPIQLVIIGGERDVQPVLAHANLLGWRTVVVDPRRTDAPRETFSADEVRIGNVDEALASLDWDDRTGVVVMTHNFDADADALAAVLPHRPPYLGVLGPPRRTELLFRRIGMDPPKELYAPVGLDLGHATPELIALSIVAEVPRVLNERSGTHLRTSRKRSDACAVVQ
jgi:xanthine/CO dehydrogenase XdhC/CoxF family maturation factor